MQLNLFSLDRQYERKWHKPTQRDNKIFRDPQQNLCACHYVQGLYPSDSWQAGAAPFISFITQHNIHTYLCFKMKGLLGNLRTDLVLCWCHKQADCGVLQVTIRGHDHLLIKARSAADPENKQTLSWFLYRLKMAASGAGSPGRLVQYVVVRSDLVHKLSWPLGAVITQACHAATAAIHLHYSDPDTQQYLAELDSMHKVVLGVSATRHARLHSNIRHFTAAFIVWTYCGYTCSTTYTFTTCHC